jgi:Protein of unknown function (DUF1553)/Protein of unknown function (DUF1549)/Planctomycete cytochrome C/NedA-like, galactose-binding domain
MMRSDRRHRGRSLALFVSLSLIALLALGLPSTTRPSLAALRIEGDATPDFALEIRPILSRHCFACHGPDEQSRAAGLRLDTEEGAREDRGEGPAFAPGSPQKSLAWRRMQAADEDERMPPPDHGVGPSPAERELISRWIASGAEYAPHWSFLPPVARPRPARAAVAHPDWPRRPFDHHVLARLEAAGLGPAPPADRYEYGRRLAFDLTGLPPSPERLDAFAADGRPDAISRYIDELLTSPAYAERWAAVWLDLARYADSTGYASDFLREIWRYRDWVIEAIDRNQPLDEFALEQLAGDLVPDATMEQRLATAFHRNTMTNNEGGTDDEEFRVAAVRDRIETTFQVFTGLTLQCARCHDHKFDPISQREYFQLFDIFNQTADADRADDSPRLETPTAAQAAELSKIDAEIAALEASLGSDAALDDREKEALLQWQLARSKEDLSFSAAPLPPRGRSSAGELAREADGFFALKATSSSVPRARHEIELPSATAISSLQLEVVPGPNGLLGLNPSNGNIVINHAEIVIEPSAPRRHPHARFLRIALEGEGRILSLAEVAVRGPQGELIQPESARQSSTSFAGPARLAIDGVTDGRFEAGSVTHTATEKDPWWEADLGAEKALASLRLFNRTDAGLGVRLAKARVELLDARRRLVFATRIAETRPEIAVDLQRAPRHHRFLRAAADFAQKDWPARHLLHAGDARGWALGPRQAEPHVLRLALAEAIRTPDADRGVARLRLEQNYGDGHILQRFRIKVSHRSGIVQVPPAEVLAVLELAEAERRPEHLRRLHRFVRTQLLPDRQDKLADLRRRRHRLKIPTTPVMKELPEGERRQTHIHVAGNHRNRGEVVRAALPAFLPDWPEGAPKNRLGLARWLFSAENPLTARVLVNRIWARLFGRGLVETEEDFGAQGALPSHPAVLDELARFLRDSGWDRRALLREIVSSATYRQASRVSPAAGRKDPENRLFSRGPRQRLDAEMVRDQALALAGLLVHKRGGPSVYPYQPPGLWRAAFNGGDRRWPMSEGADRYRRGLYTFLRRTAPYPSMTTFDATSRELCTVRRIATNTPLQALVTLNDPVFIEAAQALARRVLHEAEGEAARAERLLRLALGRPARVSEIEGLRAFIRAQSRELSLDPPAARRLAKAEASEDPVLVAAWTAAANAVLNLDEVLTR